MITSHGGKNGRYAATLLLNTPGLSRVAISIAPILLKRNIATYAQYSLFDFFKYF